MRLLWRTEDPDGTAFRLASTVGARVDEAGTGPTGQRELVVPLAGGSVVIVASDGVDRLALDERASGPGPEPPAALRGAPSLLGVAWATVDTDRALPGIASALGITPATFAPGTADECLGATARVAPLGTLVVAVLEPSTEGRLAAVLARCGEGPCGIYVASASSAATRPGPLGPAWLAMAERPWGPFVLAVRRRSAAPR